MSWLGRARSRGLESMEEKGLLTVVVQKLEVIVSVSKKNEGGTSSLA